MYRFFVDRAVYCLSKMDPSFSYFVRVYGSNKKRATERANAVKAHIESMGLQVRKQRYVKTRGCYVMLLQGYWKFPQLSINIDSLEIYDTWAHKNERVMSIDVFSDIKKVENYCRTNFDKHSRVFNGHKSKDQRWNFYWGELINQSFQWWYDQFESVGQTLQSITVDEKTITVILLGLWEFNFSIVLADEWQIVVGQPKTFMLRLTFVVTPDVPQIVVSLSQQATRDAEDFFESIGTKRVPPPPPPPSPPPPHPPLSFLTSFIPPPPPYESLFTLGKLKLKGDQYAAIALPQEPLAKKTRQELPAIPADGIPSVTRPERHFLR